MYTYGAFHPQVNIQQNQHISIFFKEQFSLGHAWERIWKSWAPGKCKFFLWLVAHDKCWTTDRLARRGLPHPAQCPLCDQEEETVNHLLVSCVFARQFWFYLLQHFGIQQFCPQPSDLSFDVWWENSSNATVGLTRGSTLL